MLTCRHGDGDVAPLFADVGLLLQVYRKRFLSEEVPNFFSRSFQSMQADIEKSHLYNNFVRKLPKGILRHLHTGAHVSPDILVDNTYHPWVYYSESEKRFEVFPPRIYTNSDGCAQTCPYYCNVCAAEEGRCFLLPQERIVQAQRSRASEAAPLRCQEINDLYRDYFAEVAGHDDAEGSCSSDVPSGFQACRQICKQHVGESPQEGDGRYRAWARSLLTMPDMKDDIDGVWGPFQDLFMVGRRNIFSKAWWTGHRLGVPRDLLLQHIRALSL